jgi:quercetin dioxygenase-like cupin family protein
MLTHSEQLFVRFDDIDWEVAGPGIRRKVMAYGDNLMAVHAAFEKGAVGPLHTHPHVQITLVRKGVFEVQIGGEKQVLREGDYFYVPSNIEHGGVALEETVLIDIFSPMRKEFVSR